MAPSATCPAHSFSSGVLVSKKQGYCSNYEYICKNSILYMRQSIHSKPHLSVEMSSSCLLPNDKKFEREESGRFLLKNRFQCRSLDFERTVPNVVEQKLTLNDVIEAQQFDRDTLSSIFEVAREMESIEQYSAGSEMLKGYLMATLFYEPSTRTRLSFESAMKRLGGEVLTTENAREFSSASKGETLEGS